MNYRTIAFTNLMIIFASAVMLTVAIATHAWLTGDGDMDLGQYMSRLTRTNSSSPVLATFVDIFKGLTVSQKFSYGLRKVCHETIFSSTTLLEPAALTDKLVQNINQCENIKDIILSSQELKNKFKYFKAIYVLMVVAIICNILSIITAIFKSPFLKIPYSKLIVLLTTILSLIAASCNMAGIVLVLRQQDDIRDYLKIQDAGNTESSDAMTRNILRSFDFTFLWSNGYSFRLACASQALLWFAILQNGLEYILRHKEDISAKKNTLVEKAEISTIDQNGNQLKNKLLNRGP